MNPEGLPKQEEVNYIDNVAFKPIKNKEGQILYYASSDRGRKVIKLPVGMGVDVDKVYKVRILKDTEPNDPETGYYEGTIDDSESGSDSVHWPHVEILVDSLERSKRAAQNASVELFDETGIPRDQRIDMTEVEIASNAKNPRVALKALESQMENEQRVKEVLGEDSTEKTFVDFQKANLTEALRGFHDIESKEEELLREETSILEKLGDEPTGSALEALDEIRTELELLAVMKHRLYQSSPEAFYGLHLLELKGYKDDLERGKIVETPYVKERINDVVAHMRAQKPVLIYGHLGSGKTELAMHVARKYILADRPDIDKKIETDFDTWFVENPNASRKEQQQKKDELEVTHRSALVISGSKNMSTAELYGHQVLDIEGVDKTELDSFAKEVEGKYNAWVKEHEVDLTKLTPEEKEQEKNRAHDRILQTYLTQFKNGTISDYFLGPIYQAMEEGRPVIIDEVNAIPHEVLISLNHILTRKAGDEISVQQDSGKAVTIKNGYGVIMTGNLNQGQDRYVDRQDMDPAFLSRLYKMEYDYLPQATEGTFEEASLGDNELFHLLLSRIMDKRGNINAPNDAIVKLWDLAKAARVTQNVFAGKETNSAYYFKEAGTRGVQYLLKESVLSLRNIDRVITQWQKDGYRYELDYYIWTEFISQSTTPTDKAYLYQLFKDQFGFFSSEWWDQKPNYGNGGSITSFDIKVPKRAGTPLHLNGPRETVSYGFGLEPRRKEWPKQTRDKNFTESENTS